MYATPNFSRALAGIMVELDEDQDARPPINPLALAVLQKELSDDQDTPPIHSPVLAAMMDAPPERRLTLAILDRPEYAKVRHLLRPCIVAFVATLTSHFNQCGDGSEIRQYLADLSWCENGAVFRDLCGAASIAFLTSRPAFCDQLDQLQLFHFFQGCCWPHLPGKPVKLAKIPVHGYLESPGKYGFEHAVMDMERRTPHALCELVLGHTMLDRSPALCVLFIRRWADVVEDVLSGKTPKFRASRTTQCMLMAAAVALSSPTSYHTILYDFAKRVRSNSAIQYAVDKDEWYASIVCSRFVEKGPKFASFRGSISSMFMSALDGHPYKVVLDGRTYPAVLLDNQTWAPADEWSASFHVVVDELTEAHGVGVIGDVWVDEWDRHFDAFKLRCASCLELPGAPLEIGDWVPFKSALPPPVEVDEKAMVWRMLFGYLARLRSAAETQGN
jgi:hypothetical protein